MAVLKGVCYLYSIFSTHMSQWYIFDENLVTYIMFERILLQVSKVVELLSLSNVAKIWLFSKNKESNCLPNKDVDATVPLGHVT